MHLSVRYTASLILSLLFTVSVASSQTWRLLLNTADSLAQSGHTDAAVSAGERAFQVSQEFLATNDSTVATLLLRLAKEYRAREAFDLAEKCYTGCLQIRRRVLGSDHLDVAKALNGLAILMWQLGEYDEAESLNKEALSIREQHLGSDHLEVSESLSNLGLVYLDQRKYMEGQDLLMRALVIEKKINGNHSLSVAQSELNLGNAYYTQADYNHAEEYYIRALQTREKVLGSQHPDVAQLYDNLGMCYYDLGRFAEAEMLHKKALAIFQQTSGRGKRELAISMQNLGILYTETRQYDLAEQYLNQALDLRKHVFGFDNPEVAVSYANLADLMVLRKRYAEAETLYLRALPICNEHERLAMTNALADLYTDVGRYHIADSLYRSLEAAWIRSGTNVHPQRADFLGSYAFYFRHRKNTTRAEAYARSALRMWNDLFTIGATVMSERDALAYSLYTNRSASDYLSCLYRVDGRFVQARGLADVVLSSKGTVSDLVFERRKSRSALDSLARALESKLRNVQLALVRAYNGEMEFGSPSIQRRTIDSLNKLSNNLESQVARRSSQFRTTKETRNVTAPRVAAALPPHGILVEYLRWEYVDITSDKDVEHYLVAVIPQNGTPFVADLGTADRIDQAIKRYRKHLIGLSEKLSTGGQQLTKQDQTDYSALATELYGLLWKPIAGHISGEATVFIAPDAGINLVSFAGLIDEAGSYLVEKHPLHYFTAGRDLIRLKVQDISGSGLIAFGDPDYDAPVGMRKGAGGAVHTSAQNRNDASNIRSVCGNLKETRVGRLFNTRQEVESVAEYWKQDYRNEPAVVYTDAGASEENLKINAQGKRVIHLATHGYFIQDECLPKQSGKALGEAVTHVLGENPLLQSGLFLAGSNLHGAGTEEMQSEDGVVTALEVSSLDLRGVELVTLSSCETALGEVKQGEGVYGLRRAFQLAGARTVVSALWRVPDDETKAIMKSFYAQKGLSYPELLQKAAVEHINDLRIVGRPTHPYTWGAFIATGDWRRK